MAGNATHHEIAAAAHLGGRLISRVFTMKHVHVVIPDLFLPQSLAKEVCAGLSLPVLEKFLARSKASSLPTHSLEAWLCEAFAVPDSAIAPVTLLADGLKPEDGYWLRADPVHLRLDRSQMILQTNISVSLEDAQQLCAYLNQHFADSGMHFFAPHPQRWYVRLEDSPELVTHSVYQVEGRNSRFYLPQGATALKWHGVMNEIQMVLYGHPINQACAERGALPPNSVWLWGGGRAVALPRPFDLLYGDSELAISFAQAANIAHVRTLEEKAQFENALYVSEGLSAALRRGDFHTWRESVTVLERDCLAPLLRLLVAGEIDRITLDVLQEENSRRYELTRPMLWKVWLRAQPLANYALV